MADSQNVLDTGLNIDAQFATNSAENPLTDPLEQSLENTLDNELWQYAYQVYSQTGVEAALLALQDDHGADINLILQALWLASEGKQWTEACIPADYDQWIAEQVLPLRKMRRRMKVDWPEQEGFRQRVKNLELKAEQYGLEMLFEGGLQEVVMKDDEIKSEAGFVNSNLIQLAQYLNIPHNYFESLISLI
ncbi:MAG: TIGR02444 family protein [Oleispira antarctica]|nr:TIGR02444 family protein [Oleispira antarctica]MBQ0794195.1 TIGR02444 family protein [Oleispira antarctica]